MKNDCVLVCGLGSAGKRHLRNAYELCSTVLTWDPAMNPSHSFEQFLDLHEGTISKAVIASPPQYHCDQVIACVERGITVLCEKPLAMTIDEVERIENCLALERTNACVDPAEVYVGYQMRFMESLQQCRIDAKVAAATNFFSIVHVTYGHDIGQWRAQMAEPYETVAGAMLECSHELDYLIWMFDDVPHILSVDVHERPDATCESAMVAMLRWGSVVSLVSLDYQSLVHKRDFILRSAKANVEWTYDCEEGERAYYEELRMFLSDTSDKTPLCTFDEAYKVQSLIDRFRLAGKE